MSRLYILLILLVVSGVMGLGQYYSYIYHWYWVYWWFDIIMHFGGGIVVYLIAYAAGARTLARLIATVVFVGVVWEIYEWGIGSNQYPESTTDSIIDLGMDIVGGLTAYGIMSWWHRYLSSLRAEHDVSPDPTS